MDIKRFGGDKGVGERFRNLGGMDGILDLGEADGVLS